MNQNPGSSDWGAARGEKWLSQLSGMEATLAPVDEPLIAALELSAPYRIAEVGSGGGGTALEILRRAPRGSVVHGFDISPALVQVARKRIPAGESAIHFEVADMASAAPPAPYERLVSRFGIMFFDDPAAAFANLARWLAPGGRFAFAVWAAPDKNPSMTTARDVVASIIELPASDPEAPNPFRYAQVDKLLALLEQAGLSELAWREQRVTLPIRGGVPAAEAAHFVLASFSNFAELLAQAGDAALARARQALTERLAEYQRDGTVQMDAYVHIVTGTRPS